MAPAGALRFCALEIFFFVSGKSCWVRDSAFELPWTPAFLHKHGGLILSIGQFNQWVGTQLMASGFVQIWPGTPVSAPLFADPANLQRRGIAGLRLADQGVDKHGAPADGFMPGMDVRAQLTVVGDGPVGAVGQRLDERFGLPARPRAPRVGARHEVRDRAA